MNDKQKIEKLVNDYTISIHNQDKEFFYQLWTQEENNVLISLSNEFKGVDSIYNDFLIGRIKNNYSSIDLIVESIRIDFINTKTARVIFQYHTECILRNTQEKYGIEGLETQIVVKKNNEWKFMHIHYSK